MKERFLFNNTMIAYHFISTFLQKNYNIQKVKGKVRKDYLEIEFKYNSLEPCLSISHFNEGCFARIKLCFYPFKKYGNFISYSLSGKEINITNLKKLLKLCRLYDVPICKKCGKHPIEYYENCINKTTYSADLTGNPYIYEYVSENGFYSHAPFPINIEAKCSCGNKWIPRGIISTQQIVDISALDDDSYYLRDRHHTKVFTQEEIDDMLTKPTEYAKLLNKNHLKKRTLILTKKEINELLNAINAGGKPNGQKKRSKIN